MGDAKANAQSLQSPTTTTMQNPTPDQDRMKMLTEIITREINYLEAEGIPFCDFLTGLAEFSKEKPELHFATTYLEQAAASFLRDPQIAAYYLGQAALSVASQAQTDVEKSFTTTFDL
jgi:hypothetical protein